MRLERLRRNRDQRGQVLPIFALMALVVVGAVALAVDYGFLTNQHRNLQTFTDNAAIAGAEQLSPDGASLAKARKSAMTYIRDNLKASFPVASGDPVCSGSPHIDYTKDIGVPPNGCVLPSPFNNYTVTIRTPGNPQWQGANSPYGAQTLSVEVTDAVANTAANVLGIDKSSVSAGAMARSQPAGQHLPTALYTDGCINTSSVSVPVVVDGDIYLNECTVRPALAGGFCAVTTPISNGNITFGPEAFKPGNILQGQNLANCQAQLLGIVTSMGRVQQVPTSIIAPPLPGPPQGPDTCGSEGSCLANHLCKNGTVKSDGTIPNNCYDPGVYSNGTELANIRNNLNPGIYYVDVSSGTCYNDPNFTSCSGVDFQGNTMNANINGVIDKCWAPLNVPATNTFVSPCPDGLIADPTLTAVPPITDPQCAVSPAVLAVNPLAWSGSSTTGGTLAPGTYSVRISTLGGPPNTTAFETAATAAQSVTVAPGNNAIGISIPTAGVGETNGYNVYIGTAGREQFARHIPHGGLLFISDKVVNPPAPNAQHYSLFDNSYCLLGFHNIPHSKDANQNFGVTFVLTGKAGICMGASSNGYCAPSGVSTVMLDPYCASGFTPNPESATCSNASAEDGAYAVYGSSQGAIRTSGLLSYMNMSGTVYLPRGQLIEDATSRFSLTPGQMVVHDVSLTANANLLNPVVYYAPNGAVIPPSVALIQ